MAGAQAGIRVFAGPSRPETDVAAEIDWAPPARAGDLRAAAHAGFPTLVLADTLFLDAAPSHREILDVIRDGVRVVGCASSGALRAVELEAHGMRGGGAVFRLYRDGPLNDDAELACVLDADYRAVAPPLIELRMMFGRLALEAGEPPAFGAAFRAIADLYFLRRDRAALRRIAAAHLGGAARGLLETWLDDPVFALKARDVAHVARALVRPDAPGLETDPLMPQERAWLACGLRF